LNWYALLPLAGFLANLGLAPVVLARSPRARTNQLYAILAAAIAYWSLLKFATRLVSDAESSLLLYTASSLGWCFLPSLCLHFVIAFTREPDQRDPRWVYAAHLLGLTFVLLTFVPGAMVISMEREPWGFVHVPGPVYYVFAVFLVLSFCASIVIVARARRQAKTAARRAQCGFLLVGTSIPLVGGVVTNMILPMAGITTVELAEVLSTINVALVAYAMRRHGLLALSLEQATEAILATMGDALLVANGRGEVVLCNPAAEKLLAMTAPEIAGQPLSRFVRSELVDLAAAAPGEVPRVEEAEYLPAIGEPIPVMLSVSSVRSQDGSVAGIVCVAQDIRDLRRTLLDLAEANRRLEQQAVTDDLTGVANRRHARERLSDEYDRACRYRRTFSIGLMDLDDFKQVNDRLGHEAGDRLLREVGATLRALLRSTDFVARWGGDEFLIIFEELDGSSARDVGERLLAGIASLSSANLRVGASLGLATLDPRDPPADVETLVRRADVALYRAKDLGKGRVVAAPTVAEPEAEAEAEAKA
jgi:diguanylate cyclase (GGDEF)-like protein/PAS domain S-box-containing protein